MHCEGCNLTFGSAEKRITLHKKVFHEECFIKHLRGKQPLKIEEQEERVPIKLADLLAIEETNRIN